MSKGEVDAEHRTTKYKSTLWLTVKAIIHDGNQTLPQKLAA
jgi:hypothetical protein